MKPLIHFLAGMLVASAIAFAGAIIGAATGVVINSEDCRPAKAGLASPGKRA